MAATVVCALPSATNPLGEMVMVDCAAFGEPAMATTVVVTEALPKSAVIVFVSALVVLSVVE